MKAREESYARFLREVASHAGLKESGEGRRLAEDVLGTIGCVLPAALRRDLAEVLPVSLAEAVLATPVLRAYRRSDELLMAVALQEKVSVGIAKEHIGVVCEALRGLVGAELHGRISAAVGATLCAEGFSHDIKTKVSRPLHGERNTLSCGRPGGERTLANAREESENETIAGGRPGGRNPLSEARPRSYAKARGEA